MEHTTAGHPYALAHQTAMHISSPVYVYLGEAIR